MKLQTQMQIHIHIQIHIQIRIQMQIQNHMYVQREKLCICICFSRQHWREQGVSTYTQSAHRPPLAFSCAASFAPLAPAPLLLERALQLLFQVSHIWRKIHSGEKPNKCEGKSWILLAPPPLESFSCCCY